jgi:hypothetical protein
MLDVALSANLRADVARVVATGFFLDLGFFFGFFGSAGLCGFFRFFDDFFLLSFFHTFSLVDE